MSLLVSLIASGSLASLMKVILLVDVFEVSEMRHGSHANQPLVHAAEISKELKYKSFYVYRYSIHVGNEFTITASFFKPCRNKKKRFPQGIFSPA